jgi:predicted ATPase/class 3 adenylate cyclase
MAALPTGTVTFFFSDIEGSTRLLEVLGRDYSDLLERHRRITRDAFSRSAGVEMSTEGDSFFAVFPSAADAVAAAVVIQRAISVEEWPQAVTLRVRIGLHTGEARIADQDYVGLDVHRAARIMAAGHGGQIIISDATHALVERSLGDGIELRDLGQHRLRDLSAPERLFQVLAEGLPTDFPALRSLDATPNNLPTQASELVGREAELSAIGDHLASTSVRLLTLTGPGGIGKTRLALQAGADHMDAFPHGVYFVDLSAVRDPAGALQAIVQAVGLKVSGEDRLRQAIAEQLQTRRLLLLLDNFEQVMPAADDVAALLSECPDLKVLVTSREALRVRGEQLFPVAPLSLPDSSLAGTTAHEASQYDAVRLFVQRAQQARPSFQLTDDNAAAVAEICARLDGLPLAIELAAASLKLFSPNELRDRLRSRLELLRGAARELPARQRTLRSTIEWSYELLDDEERRLFQLLSVFSSARVDAVEEVSATLKPLAEVDVLDRLASLVDKSLVRSVEDAGGQRLSMLETIRTYAGEQLDAEPELSLAARRAHAEYFAEFSQARRDLLQGPGREKAVDDLASELGNLQTAWRYFVDSGDVSQLNKLIDPMWVLHDARGWYHGNVALTNDLLEVLSKSAAGPDRAEEEITLRLSLARGLLAIRGYSEEVEQVYREALALSEAAGGMPKRFPVLRSLASFHLYRGELDKTAAIGRQIIDLAEEQHDARLELEGRLILGPASYFMGETEAGQAHLDRAVALFDPVQHGSSRFRLGPNPGVVANAISALQYWVDGRPDFAAKRAASALDLAAQLRHPYTLAYATFHVGLLELWRGRREIAQGRANEVLAIADEHDYQIWRALGLVLAGVTAAGLGHPEEGLERTDQGIALYEGLRTPPVFWPQVLGMRAEAGAFAGETTEAADLLERAISMLPEANWVSVSLVLQRADLLLSMGDASGAESLVLRAFERAQALKARIYALKAATRLARMADAAGRKEAAARLREVYEVFTEGFDEPDLLEARAALDELSLPGS